MARPLKAGLDYFSHDTEAHADQKIQSLMALYGADGYAFYFIMLEKVFRSENGAVSAGKPVEKAGLARAMCLTLKKFDQILETALEVGCFDSEIYKKDFLVTSNGVQKRIGKIKTDREVERERKRQYLIQKEKEKEKQGGGKLPENPRKTFLPPTLEEITAYCQERKNNVKPEKWLSHYESNGWMVGKNHMKDWKAAIRTWEGNEIGQTKRTLPTEVTEQKHSPIPEFYELLTPEEQGGCPAITQGDWSMEKQLHFVQSFVDSRERRAKENAEHMQKQLKKQAEWEARQKAKGIKPIEPPPIQPDELVL